MGHKDEYAIPGFKPTRIKLKETPNEAAEKIYRSEQARQARVAERIQRANGEAGPSFNPLHFPPSPRTSFHFSQSNKRDPHLEESTTSWRHTWEGRSSHADEDARIPSRFTRRTSTDYSDAPRRAEDEVQLEGGPIPSMGTMSPAHFQAWVRKGLDGLRRRHDVWVREQNSRERDRIRLEREAAIEYERAARERRARRERRKFEREQADRNAARAEVDARAAEQARKRRRTEVIDVEDDDAEERARYVSRWKALGGTGEGGADVVEVELAFGDIPWPVYRLKGGFGGIDIGMLSSERVGPFLRDLANDSGASLRKVQMEAIRQFHPDRFFGRILPRVKEKDEVAIREGVEKCSRVINALMADRNA